MAEGVVFLLGWEAGVSADVEQRLPEHGVEAAAERSAEVAHGQGRG